MLRKSLKAVASLLLAAAFLLGADAKLAGTWEAQGSHEGRMQTWLMNFDVHENAFVGSWKSLQNDSVREIKEGKIAGNDFSFKVLKKDGSTAMVCKGTVKGDQMTLGIDNLGEGDHRQATAVRKPDK